MTANNILMKNGVALWLVNHSKLSYEQIAEFCNLHPLEVEAFKNDSKNIQECNPIASLILSEDNIKRCESDFSLSLKPFESVEYGRRRKNKDISLYNATLWMLENTELEIKKIAKFLKCTAILVESIKDKSFKDYSELVAINPITLGFCTTEELNALVNKL